MNSEKQATWDQIRSNKWQKEVKMFFIEKMGMEGDHPWDSARRKAHAHGVIVAATTPNVAAALSARHINTYVYVDK
jgi:hypothetical protein